MTFYVDHSCDDNNVILFCIFCVYSRSQLQNHYLPELLGFHEGCLWFKRRMGQVEKSEFLAAESRLAHIVNDMNIVVSINKILTPCKHLYSLVYMLFDYTQISQVQNAQVDVEAGKHTPASLMALEARISKIILPFKIRLFARLNRSRNNLLGNSNDNCDAASANNPVYGSSSFKEDALRRNHSKASIESDVSSNVVSINGLESRQPSHNSSSSASASSLSPYFVSDITAFDNVESRHSRDGTTTPSSPITSDNSSTNENNDSKNESNSDSNRSISINSDSSFKEQGLPQNLSNKSNVVSSSSDSYSSSDKNGKKRKRGTVSDDSQEEERLGDISTMHAMKSQGSDVVDSKVTSESVPSLSLVAPSKNSHNSGSNNHSNFPIEGIWMEADLHSRASASSSSAKREANLSQLVPNPRKSRLAEYTCYLCDQQYSQNVVENSWWAVFRHECPHCNQMQVPRIDITASINAIELDPNIVSLYGEGFEESDDELIFEQQQPKKASQTVRKEVVRAPSSRKLFKCESNSSNNTTSSINIEIPHRAGHTTLPTVGRNGESGLFDPIPHEPITQGHNTVVKLSDAADDVDDLDTFCADHPLDDLNPFGADGLLQVDEASKLLVLMIHARTCSGLHTSKKHADICNSTKLLMLHIRDCKGIDIDYRLCKFPWCLSCKSMLRHLTHCFDPEECSVCNPGTLPESFRQLREINAWRQDAILKATQCSQSLKK